MSRITQFFEVARPSEEEFLKYFFIGTRTVLPADQITNIADLPMECKQRVRTAQARGLGWTAWATTIVTIENFRAAVYSSLNRAFRIAREKRSQNKEKGLTPRFGYPG
jgi:hypothetical protein